MPLSSVACIIDKWGGRRVVVAPRKTMRYHLNQEREERIYVVPGLLVQEPVPWDDIPRVVRAAEGYARVANRPTPDDEL